MKGYHHCFLEVFWLEIISVSACAVVHADEGACNEKREEDLYSCQFIELPAARLLSDISGVPKKADAPEIGG
jgi:hypothetical protein